MFAYDPVAAPAGPGPGGGAAGDGRPADGGRRVARGPVAIDRRVLVDRRGMSIQFKPPVDQRVAARPV